MLPNNPGQGQSSATAKQIESVNPSINPSEPLPIATVHLTDDAGGVAKRGIQGQNEALGARLWYVVYVSPRAEKKVCESLQKAKYEAYIPTRWEFHKWRNGQCKKVEKDLIPGVVFVKIFDSQKEDIRKFPLVYSFMMDPARRNNEEGLKSFAIIPDSEMRLLQSMLAQENANVGFTTADFQLGDYVRIMGFGDGDEIAQVVSLSGDKNTYVGLRVSFLGCAYMEVSPEMLVKVPNNKVK